MRSYRILGVLSALLALSLSGCSFFGESRTSSIASPAASQNTGLPAGLTPGVRDAAPPPAGWYRVLNGQRFADQSAQPGISGSIAQADFLVGCPEPVLPPASAPPVLVLSKDGGHTWQSHSIPGATPQPSCAVLADAQQSGTYVVGNAGCGQRQFACIYYLTSDGGTSWRALVPPEGYIISADGSATSLVAGNLFTELQPMSGSAYRFAKLTRNGAWMMLDQNLPYRIPQNAPPNFYTPPMAFAVDPADPSHVYAAMYTGSVGVSLFTTLDSGEHWKQVYHWPTSTQIAVWTATGNRVYAQDKIDAGTADQFFYSSDGGTSWTSSGLHERGADEIFLGSDGRVVTLYNAEVFGLDPATGVFTRLGAAPKFRWTALCAMTSGPQATLVCGDAADTYARTLPSAP